MKKKNCLEQREGKMRKIKRGKYLENYKKKLKGQSDVLQTGKESKEQTETENGKETMNGRG